MTTVDIAKLDVENHLLRQLYGVSLTPEDKRRGARLMLAIAGADGPVPARRREALVAAAEVLGAPADAIAELRSADAAIARVEPTPHAAVFVGEALRAAAAEGPIDARRRAAIARVAKQAGVDERTLRALEGLLAVERAARANRYRLLGSPKRVEALGSGPLVEAGAHARAFELGHDVGAMPADLGWKCGCSILAIAAGDGKLSHAELAFFLGTAASMGVPREGLEQFAAFDAVNARLDSFLDDDLRPIARIVLLDAIRVARADGFADAERALAKRGARKLGIEEPWVDAMEAQLAVEDAIREARTALVAAAPAA